MGSSSKAAYPRDVKAKSLTACMTLGDKFIGETRRGKMTTADLGRYMSALNIQAGFICKLKEFDYEERMKAIERILEDRNYR